MENNSVNKIQGMRKFIYSILFSIFTVGVVVLLKFAGKELNEYETIVLVVANIGYPTFNTLSKLFSELLSQKVLKVINKIGEKFAENDD